VIVPSSVAVSRYVAIVPTSVLWIVSVAVAVAPVNLPLPPVIVNVTVLMEVVGDVFTPDPLNVENSWSPLAAVVVARAKQAIRTDAALSRRERRRAGAAARRR
jgi:hypothetical protein